MKHCDYTGNITAQFEKYIHSDCVTFKDRILV